MSDVLAQHKKPPRTPITRELAVLYKRTFTEIIRNPTLLAMHCIMALVMGLLCGGIFYHISNDIAGAQNRLGAPRPILPGPCPPGHLCSLCCDRKSLRRETFSCICFCGESRVFHAQIPSLPLLASASGSTPPPVHDISMEASPFEDESMQA